MKRSTAHRPLHCQSEMVDKTQKHRIQKYRTWTMSNSSSGMVHRTLARKWQWQREVIYYSIWELSSLYQCPYSNLPSRHYTALLSLQCKQIPHLEKSWLSGCVRHSPKAERMSRLAQITKEKGANRIIIIEHEAGEIICLVAFVCPSVWLWAFSCLNQLQSINIIERSNWLRVQFCYCFDKLGICCRSRI